MVEQVNWMTKAAIIVDTYLLVIRNRHDGLLLVRWRGRMMVDEVAPLALGLLCTSHVAPAQALGCIIRSYFCQMHLPTPRNLQLLFSLSLLLSPRKKGRKKDRQNQTKPKPLFQKTLRPINYVKNDLP
jgi:hypothetical protein